MSDPISDRMDAEARAEWERLRKQGYALLAQAHFIYMKHVEKPKKA